MFLLEAGSLGRETVQEPRVRGTFAVGSSYQATTDEDKEE
jgi:hypothetical protein